MARTISSTPQPIHQARGQVRAIVNTILPSRTDWAEDVARPSDFGIPYEDLELKTSDDILLRCYLLLQKRELSSSHPDAAYLDVGNLSEDQVRFHTVPPNIPEKLNVMPQFAIAVHRQPTNGADVPRERRKPWTPNPPREDLLHAYAM